MLLHSIGDLDFRGRPDAVHVVRESGRSGIAVTLSWMIWSPPEGMCGGASETLRFVLSDDQARELNDLLYRALIDGPDA